MRACRKRNGQLSQTGICLLITILLAGMAIGVGVYAVYPRDQTVFAFILVRIEVWPGYRCDPLEFDKYRVFQDKQLNLIQSSEVLTSALRKPNIADLSIVKQERDPLAWLKNELQVGYVNESEIMRVAIRSKKPGEAIKLIDAIADVYIAEAVEKPKQELRAKIEQLNQVYNSKKNELRSMRDSLPDLSHHRDLPSIDIEKMASKVTSLEKDLADISAQREKHTRELEAPPRITLERSAQLENKSLW